MFCLVYLAGEGEEIDELRYFLHILINDDEK